MNFLYKYYIASKSKLSEYLIYLVCVLVFFQCNLLAGKIIQYSQSRQDNLILNTYVKSIDDLISDDLKLLSQGKLLSTAGFLIQNTLAEKQLGKQVLNDRLLLFSVTMISNLLSKMLPEYICYQIIIDNEIVSSSRYTEKFSSSNKSRLISAGNFDIRLELDSSSQSYGAFKYDSTSIQFYSYSFSFLILTMIAGIYRRRNAKLINESREFQNQLKIANLKNKQLDISSKTGKILQRIFMKQATQMYVQEELASNYQNDDDKSLSYLIKKNSIFPFILMGKQDTTINVDELVKHLYQLFSSPNYSSQLIIKQNDISRIYSPCDRAVFYQIIVSATHNIMMFLDEQSSSNSTLTLIITKNKIEFNYQGYLLNEETMINLSESLQQKDKHVFILSCKKLFKSIKEHDIEYTVGYFNGKNNLVLDFASQKLKKPSDGCDIIQFKSE